MILVMSTTEIVPDFMGCCGVLAIISITAACLDNRESMALAGFRIKRRQKPCKAAVLIVRICEYPDQ